MDWSSFFNMGGYALYIWGSYTIALIVLGVNILQSKHRLKKAQQQAIK
jgi:heme exporter protein CcmD